MTRVLVTRPKADAAPLAAALAGRGYKTLVQPLLAIVPLDPPPPVALDGVQALLFTSANGLRGFARACPARHLPVYAVGDASAAAARDAGFETVASAGGDVGDLAALVRANCDPSRGALLHAGGSRLAGDLAGDLARDGFAVQRLVLYKAEPAAGLEPEVSAALRGGQIDAVLFFSPRTAETFVTLVRRQDLAAACRTCVAVCLSAAVGHAVEALPWRGLRIAAQPDQRALLAALDEALATEDGGHGA